VGVYAAGGGVALRLPLLALQHDREVIAFVVAFLVVIPEGNLLLPLPLLVHGLSSRRDLLLSFRPTQNGIIPTGVTHGLIMGGAVEEPALSVVKWDPAFSFCLCSRRCECLSPFPTSTYNYFHQKQPKNRMSSPKTA
jgi:hypothetical protein